MAVVKVFAFILLAATACSALPSRIVGGSPTTVERYPSIVQVDSLGVFTNQWGQSCGANILNNVYILSAAHCFAGLFYQRERRRIRAGATFRNTGGVVIYIVREYNHPTYGQLGADGDITVVRLQNELPYSPVVQPGPIVNQGADLPDNTAVYHAGWGHTTESGVASPQLLDVTIYTVNFELCRQRYADLRPWPQTVTQNMICAGILDVGGKDACQGDSGGPLYLDNNGADLLVGVVSWGEGCANDTYPGVSTKVSSYTTWIQNTAV